MRREAEVTSHSPRTANGSTFLVDSIGVTDVPADAAEVGGGGGGGGGSELDMDTDMVIHTSRKSPILDTFRSFSVNDLNFLFYREKQEIT